MLSTHIFQLVLSNEKTVFADYARVKPTIFFIEKISFSLKLFSSHFYGQSYIKTVRGPSIILFLQLKHCRSKSADLIKSQLIRKRTVFHPHYKLINFVINILHSVLS